MITLLILAPILLAVFVVTRILRLITRPFRPYGRHYNPYGLSAGFPRRRPHRFGRGLLTILGLYAVDQFFTNRRP